MVATVTNISHGTGLRFVSCHPLIGHAREQALAHCLSSLLFHLLFLLYSKLTLPLGWSSSTAAISSIGYKNIPVNLVGGAPKAIQISGT